MGSTDPGNPSQARDSNTSGISRRVFLRGTATAALAGTAGLSVLLNACGGQAAPAAGSAGAGSIAASPARASSAAPSAAASKPAVSGAAGGNIKGILPTYIPAQLPFKPELPGTGNIDDAYTKFPANPFKSVKETPGTGSTLSVFSGSAWPPYTPANQNPMLQELQKQLNVKLNLSITTITDYPVKYNTVIAGNDLPDAVWIGPTANLVDMLKAKFADLTPYLAGDNIKEYPNLANIHTTTWKGCVFGGAIYGLPCPLGAFGMILQINKSRWDAEVGPNVVAKDPADLKKIFQKLTNPSANKWALASNGADPYGVTTGYFAMMFGAPNMWGLVNGKLTNYRETDAYKESIAYLRDLVQLGVFHPKSPTYDMVAAKGDQQAGQFDGITSFTFYGNHIDMWNRGAALNPPVKFDIMPLVPAKAGDKPNYWLSPFIWPKSPYIGPGIFALKKASPERIKEQLRIWNFMAAPFGSQERLLWEYGVKGIDYTVKDDGDILPTKRGPADSTFVPWRFLIHSPDPLYNPGTPDFGPTMQKDEQAMIPLGTLDATIGVYSNTDATKSVPLSSAFQSVMVDIVAGRRPISDYDQAIKAWQSNGGDQIRKEYEQGLAGVQ